MRIREFQVRTDGVNDPEILRRWAGVTTNDNLAIEATGLVKCFGETRAVDGLDLNVDRGAVYGVQRSGPGPARTRALPGGLHLLEAGLKALRRGGRDLVINSGLLRV